jgi:hypothetical protein
VLDNATIVGGTITASGPGGALQPVNVGTGTTDTIHDSLVDNAGTWNIGAGGSNGTKETLIFDGVLNNTGTVAWWEISATLILPLCVSALTALPLRAAVMLRLPGTHSQGLAVAARPISF